jgi:hypothetical protein
MHCLGGGGWDRSRAVVTVTDPAFPAPHPARIVINPGAIS